MAAWQASSRMRGNARAADAVKCVLEQRGELAEAEAADRRADERGDPAGAYNLARSAVGDHNRHRPDRCGPSQDQPIAG